MPNDLTAARLRELIAAATPGPWKVHENPRYWIRLPLEEDGDPNRDNNAEFIAYLATHAPALADALAKVKIYEDALIAISKGRGGCEQVYCADVADEALGRAAKEAGDAK